MNAVNGAYFRGSALASRMNRYLLPLAAALLAAHALTTGLAAADASQSRQRAVNTLT